MIKIIKAETIEEMELKIELYLRKWYVLAWWLWTYKCNAYNTYNTYITQTVSKLPTKK